MKPTSSAKARRDDATQPKKWDLSHFPVELVTVATENNLLYDQFGIANEDDLDLTLSIRDKGILEPLTLSADLILLSGHLHTPCLRTFANRVGQFEPARSQYFDGDDVRHEAGDHAACPIYSTL